MKLNDYVFLSTIRREIPEMDDMEFERLDKLSGGKLRHLLVGSPSGYSWSEQVAKFFLLWFKFNRCKVYTLETEKIAAFIKNNT